MTKRSIHSGFTLIEVTIFVAIFSMVLAVMLPMLFTSTETRLRQQTIALVEDNGTQVVIHLTGRIHAAESILEPPIGQTGSVLAMQMATDDTHPTIFGVQTGVVMMIEGSTSELLTSSQVAVQNFVVTNTSLSANEPSVTVTFMISRTIRLQAPHSYVRTFELLASPYPDDQLIGNACGCTAPTCSNDVYSWESCSASSCGSSSIELECD